MYWIWANERASEAEAASFAFPLSLQRLGIVLDEGYRLENSLPTIEFTVEPSGEGRLTDNFIVAPRAGLVFSSRLQTALSVLGVGNIDYYDCRIVVQRTGLINTDYKLANLIGRIAGINIAESNLEMRPDIPGAIEFINSLTLDEERFAKNLLVRLEEFPQIIVVHEIVKNCLNEIGISGVKFYAPEEFSL